VLPTLINSVYDIANLRLPASEQVFPIYGKRRIKGEAESEH
jgi:hypothetical protein